MNSLDILNSFVVFLGCLCLATPVVAALWIGHVCIWDARDRRRQARRLPSNAASNVTKIARIRPYDFEEADA